jgi:hypothetical protein
VDGAAGAQPTPGGWERGEGEMMGELSPATNAKKKLACGANETWRQSLQKEFFLTARPPENGTSILPRFLFFFILN